MQPAKGRGPLDQVKTLSVVQDTPAGLNLFLPPSFTALLLSLPSSPLLPPLPSGRTREEALEKATKKFNMPKEKLILDQGGWSSVSTNGLYTTWCIIGPAYTLHVSKSHSSAVTTGQG